jgi:hypothetical protein
MLLDEEQQELKQATFRLVHRKTGSLDFRSESTSRESIPMFDRSIDRSHPVDFSSLQLWYNFVTRTPLPRAMAGQPCRIIRKVPVGTRLEVKVSPSANDATHYQSSHRHKLPWK